MMNSDQKIKIVVLDHQALIRNALATTLSLQSGLKVIGGGASLDDCGMPSAPDPATQVLLNYDMPGRTADRLIEQLGLRYPNIRITALTGLSNMCVGSACFPHGLFAVVHKGCSLPSLYNILRMPLSESSPASPIYVFPPEFSKQPGGKGLSTREFQVLRALIVGQSPTDIAKDLNITRKTVYSFRRRLLLKLGLKNTAELIHFALASGIGK